MKRKRGHKKKKKKYCPPVASSIEVDMSWVKVGVNVLLDSGDDEKPFVATVRHVDMERELVKVESEYSYTYETHFQIYLFIARACVWHAH